MEVRRPGTGRLFSIPSGVGDDAEDIVLAHDEVLAIGNGKILEDGTVRKLDVKVGDRILFGKYSGTEVKVDGEERLILREDDILGVLEK